MTMHTLNASGLLDMWEQGCNLAPPQRTLAMLVFADPKARREELMTLSLGRCNARLLRLREELFGSQLDFVAPCPACASVVEATLDSTRLARDAPVLHTQTVRLDAHSVVLRAPQLGDLFDLPRDPVTARHALVSRCVADGSDAERNGASFAPAAIDAISAALAASDAAGSIELALECPDCSQRWLAAFDIATFLWHEIDVWARRTLREVHALARAYAWREPDVLALSPTRRQIYLELSGA